MRLLGFMALLPFGMYAKDLCAVRVLIEGLPAASVELVDASGKTVAQTAPINGVAEFCDFGFGEHSIVVGGDACGSVVIRKVRLYKGGTQEFHVVLQGCAGTGGSVFPPSCLTYFRVSSSTGEKLPAVTVTVPNDDRVFKGDGYGRVWLGMLNGASQTFTFSATGHRSSSITFHCENYQNIEHSVVLERITPVRDPANPQR